MINKGLRWTNVKNFPVPEIHLETKTWELN